MHQQTGIKKTNMKIPQKNMSIGSSFVPQWETDGQKDGATWQR